MIELFRDLTLWQKVAAGVVLLLCAGVIAVSPAQKQPTEKVRDAAGERIFTHGFTTGFSMAKGGAVKPTGDQVDALSRRAAAELGESGGLGFKMAWKGAFWEGWRRGD